MRRGLRRSDCSPLKGAVIAVAIGLDRRVLLEGGSPSARVWRSSSKSQSSIGWEGFKRRANRRWEGELEAARVMVVS